MQTVAPYGPRPPPAPGAAGAAAGPAGTLRRLQAFSGGRAARRCRNCRDAGVVVVDQHTGDELCSRCGLVLEGRVLSEEQEWRNFSSNDDGGGGDRSRVGGPNDTWFGSGGVQGTTMMGTGSDPKHDRLMQAHEMAIAAASDQGERSLRNSFARLKNVADYFDLKENIVERCKEIIKDLQTANTIRTRTGDTYMLAVIYCACREENVPRSIKELITYNRVITEKELARAINRLKRAMPNRAQPITSTSAALISRVCSALQLSQTLSSAALVVGQRAELLINKSHRPNSLAAGAVYFVTQLSGVRLEPSDIAAAAKTGLSTVMTVYREMIPLSKELLPRDFEVAPP